MTRFHVFAAAVGTAALITGGAAAQTVGIGTGPQGTMTNAAGAAVAKVASDVFNLQTRAVPHTSNDLHLPLVNRGAIQFGMSNIQGVTAASTGTEQFEGRKLENIRVVARVFPLPVGIVTRKDSDIRTVSDLRGKRFPMGYTAQPTVVGVINAMLANGGLKPNDVQAVQVPNTTRGNEDFMQGRVDAAMGSLGGARLRQVDARVGGIRILPFDTSDEAVKRMQSVASFTYLLELKPGAGSVGLEEPIHTMAYDFLIVASTETPDEMVYQVTKAAHGNRDGLIAVSRAYEGFEPERMATRYQDVEYHPGAIKFYREAGIWPPK
jgi:uncharacterized protein